LSAEAVRGAHFSTRRRGWDEDEVQLFLSRLAGQIQAADRERAALRAELYEAHAEVNRLRDGDPAVRGQSRVEISVHAVGLLSQAQQTADSCVAEAEKYARDLVNAARGQYQEILQNAQQAASDSMRDLSAVAGAAGETDYGTPLPEIEYVRTYAKVAQVQLRSVLDALTQEVDKLGQLPRFDEAPSASVTQLSSWEPAMPLTVTQGPSSTTAP
jgi:cell division initiation protein